ncbi:hypothetical protein PC116_g17073 [Phytophthora cactorum]|uniref:Uncharacterized protein n=1 Tax=Phytophthora cactorum TaxID=29920 RepID=A0A8T1KHV4_9STRA|nr:hypothetical protein PC117_g23311 [Phytophthora cactorum]KAG2991382.1 hypothetical protein PC120_g22721 [Phytophthora cactorum]KAG3157532.1 hypothetical protein C6341_g14704 [Phytophthora cactorum]KAG4234765.1 hypothetical protein PC116_g17073 [Phytophthora cactorum]
MMTSLAVSEARRVNVSVVQVYSGPGSDFPKICPERSCRSSGVGVCPCGNPYECRLSS